jgi:hypothetical protein
LYLPELWGEGCPSAGGSLLLNHMPQMRGKNDEGIEMIETQSFLQKEISQLRAVSYIFAVLSYLQDEPLCGRCSSFAKVFEKSMEIFLVIEKALGGNRNRPEETRVLFSGIYGALSELKIPDNPVRQKKEGNCGFPAGVCLAKNALAMYEQIEEQK